MQWRGKTRFTGARETRLQLVWWQWDPLHALCVPNQTSINWHWQELKRNVYMEFSSPILYSLQHYVFLEHTHAHTGAHINYMRNWEIEQDQTYTHLERPIACCAALSIYLLFRPSAFIRYHYRHFRGFRFVYNIIIINMYYLFLYFFSFPFCFFGSFIVAWFFGSCFCVFALHQRHQKSDRWLLYQRYV